MLARLDRYSKAHARDLRESGDTGTLSRNVIRVFSRFYKCYIRRSGWKEGHWGFPDCVMCRALSIAVVSESAVGRIVNERKPSGWYLLDSRNDQRYSGGNPDHEITIILILHSG